MTEITIPPLEDGCCGEHCPFRGCGGTHWTDRRDCQWLEGPLPGPNCPGPGKYAMIDVDALRRFLSAQIFEEAVRMAYFTPDPGKAKGSPRHPRFHAGGQALTPMPDAVRKYCLWCCGGSRKEVELCPCNGTGGASNCKLHDLRFRENPSGVDYLKEIRTRCRDCLISQVEIDRCSHHDCQLWSYRPRSEEAKTTPPIPGQK